MTDFQLIREGIGFGLVLAVMVGPILITLIQSCLQGGRVAGFEVTAGIWLSDAIIMSLAYYGLVSLQSAVGGFSLESWLQYLGGAIFLMIGLFIALRKYKDFRTEAYQMKALDHGKFFVKGFLVNTLNPFTFIFWFTVAGSQVVARDLSERQAWIYLGTILGVIIITDSLKVLLSHWIRDRVAFSVLVWAQRIAGIILGGVGIYLLLFY